MKSCMEKIKMPFVAIEEDKDATHIGQEFKKFKKNEVRFLLLNESYMYKRIPVIKNEFLIFVGCPMYKFIFDMFIKH